MATNRLMAALPVGLPEANWLRYDAREKEGHMLELTEEQARALEEEKGPLSLRNPLTQEVYVLIRQDVYQLACRVVSGPNRRGWDQDDDLIREQAGIVAMSSRSTGPTAI
jgi:hypothetical protein